MTTRTWTNFPTFAADAFNPPGEPVAGDTVVIPPGSYSFGGFDFYGGSPQIAWTVVGDLSIGPFASLASRVSVEDGSELSVSGTLHATDMNGLIGGFGTTADGPGTLSVGALVLDGPSVIDINQAVLTFDTLIAEDPNAVLQIYNGSTASGGGLQIDAGQVSVGQSGFATPASLSVSGAVIGNSSTHAELSVITPGVNLTDSGAMQIGLAGTGSGVVDVGDGANASVTGAIEVGVGSTGTSFLSLSELELENGGVVSAGGSIDVGVSAGSRGEILLGSSGETAAPTLDYTGSLLIGDAGTGALIDNLSSWQPGGDGDVVLGKQAGSSGTLDLRGTATIAGNLTIGQDGTGFVSLDGTAAELTVHGTTELGAGSGIGTLFVNGPTLLPIASNQLVEGNGAIDSQIIGETPDTNGTTLDLPEYSLTLDNNGSIAAAENRSIVIHANVAGTGQNLINNSATIEVGSSVGSGQTYDFQTLDSGTLVIDDLAHFKGALTGLAAAPSLDSTLGSTIVLKNTGTGSNNPVDYAAIGTFDGTLELQIFRGTDVLHPTTSIVDIPLPNEPSTIETHDFFKVTQSGTDTVLTLTQGNPIDDAVNAQSVAQTGAGVTVGIIEGGFGGVDQIANDEHLGALPSSVTVLRDNPGHDEGRAMAQIVHFVAPDAGILFYTGDSASGGATDASLANAITQLANHGAQIIVDDLGVAEPDTGSATEKAVETAVQKDHVVYIAATGNDRAAQTSVNGRISPVFGHAADFFAESVGAVNWLATPYPSPVGGYLPAQSEPYSSQGIGFSAGKPNVSGPDGGPTTFSLPDNTNLNPFFGTSAASPAVAGVAALMLQANPALRGAPLAVDQLINASAVAFGDSSVSGRGLVQAPQAVAAALGQLHPFYSDPPVSALHVASATLSQAGGDADTGATVQFFLTMSAGVTITGGAPALTLNVGASATYDATASDPATGSLVFDYAVGSADQTPNLAVTGIALGGATIQDSGGNTADFSGLFNVPTGTSINSPLHVSTVTASQTGEVQAGQIVQVTLGLNEGATVDTTGGAPTLILNDGATATYDAALSHPSSGSLVFDYVVGAGDLAPDLSVFTVDLPNGTTLRDAAGNNVDFAAAENVTTGLQIGAAFVNEMQPSIPDAAHTGQTVQLTLAMSEAVTVDTSGGTPSLSLNDGATATYDATASDPSTGNLVFDYAVASGQQTPSLLITAVNPNGASVTDGNGVAADFSFALDAPIGPTINSPLSVTGVATSPASGTVQAGDTVEFTLTLSKAAQVGLLDAPGVPLLTLNDGEVATYDPTLSNATSLVFDYVVQPGGATPNLTITGVDPNGAPIQDAKNNNADFSAAIGVATGIDIPCFAAGTRIATARGEIAVEHLRVGDLVRFASGAEKPIVWIGRSRVDCRRHRHPERVWPVRVDPSAFADALPRRELRLSPDHAVFRDGVLIPIKYLVNGATVVQERVDSVQYFHVELDSHAVLLAEGLPAESYLDTGNRAAFANGSAAMMLHPDFHARSWNDACAPLVTDGAAVLAVRRVLLSRVAQLGFAPRTESKLDVLADGRAIQPAGVRRKLHRYVLPAGTRDVCILSSTGVPAGLDLAAADCRRLGARIGAVFVDGEFVALDSAVLASGFHPLEANGAELWRWTDGAARLVLPERAGACAIELELLVRDLISGWERAEHGTAITQTDQRRTRSRRVAATPLYDAAIHVHGGSGRSRGRRAPIELPDHQHVAAAHECKRLRQP